jgi:hypothetical protein
MDMDSYFLAALPLCPLYFQLRISTTGRSRKWPFFYLWLFGYIFGYKLKPKRRFRTKIVRTTQDYYAENSCATRSICYVVHTAARCCGGVPQGTRFTGSGCGGPNATPRGGNPRQQTHRAAPAGVQSFLGMASYAFGKRNKGHAGGRQVGFLSDHEGQPVALTAHAIPCKYLGGAQRHPHSGRPYRNRAKQHATPAAIPAQG